MKKQGLVMLKHFYYKELFNPGLWGIFLNPFYFIRRAIYKGVSKYSCNLSGRLLDFGCGSKAYQNLFNVAEYIGLDVEQSGHMHGESEVDVYYDGKIIPFDDEYFDSCFSCEVFEHVFDLEESLAEINRVLKKGGKALFVVPFVWDEHEIPFDYGRYSSYGIKYLLEKKGFSVVNSEKDTNFFIVLAQLWNLYLFNIGPKRSAFLRIMFNVLCIAPFTLISITLNFIMPQKSTLFFNNIIVAEKPS